MRLPVSECWEAAAAPAEEGMSQREIGEVLGVGLVTVNRDLKPGDPVRDRARGA